MWVFLVQEVMSSARCSLPTRSIARSSRKPSRREQSPEHHARRRQHGRPDRQQSDDGSGGLLRADWETPPAGRLSGLNAAARAQTFLVIKALSTRTSLRTICFPAHIPLGRRGRSESGADFLLDLFCDDGLARAAHDYRHRHSHVPDSLPWKGRYTPEYHAPVELTGLYWHFVDIIWIFLFPLLYLLGRHLGAGH